MACNNKTEADLYFCLWCCGALKLVSTVTDCDTNILSIKQTEKPEIYLFIYLQNAIRGSKRETLCAIKGDDKQYFVPCVFLDSQQKASQIKGGLLNNFCKKSI